MRSLVIFLAALFIPVSAFAMSDSVVDMCLGTAQPRQCIQSFLSEQQNATQAQQERWFAQQRSMQLEQARIQANGMALFGAGNALINGMNQGFHQMQQPYVNTPQFQYPQR
jgi:hypothetical protein